MEAKKDKNTGSPQQGENKAEIKGNSQQERPRETQADRDKRYDEQRERDRIWKEGVREREQQWQAEVRERERAAEREREERNKKRDEESD